MIKVNIETQTIIGDPVPRSLAGLTKDCLDNLQSHLDSGQIDQLGLQSIEYWPEVENKPGLTPGKKYGERSMSMDMDSRKIVTTYQVLDMTPQEIADEAEAIRQEKRDSVVSIMIKKQGGGVTFNGVTIATDAEATAQMAGAMQRESAWRKIVPRFGRGRKLQLAAAEFSALFTAVSNYQQAVQNWAYDLIVQIDDGLDPDVNAGWPSNEL